MHHRELTGADQALDQADQKLLGLPESKDEEGLIQDLLFQTRTEITRLRRRLERHESEHDSHVRNTRALWFVILLITIGLATDFWYRFHENTLLAARVPAIESLLSRAGGSAAASKVPDTGLEPPKPPAKPLETKSSSSIAPIVPEMDDTGLRKIQSLPKPERPLSSNSSGTLFLADSVKRSRTDFVLPLNKTREVVPGIFLTVRETSVTSQRIDGWLQIAEEGRTVPIRSQNLQTPATFTTKRDERKRAVVFTRIDKEQVAGYLLIPLPAG